MCIEMDGLFQNKNQVSPFECMKCVSLPIQGYSINLSAYINEVIYLPWTFHSLPEILFWWTHYSFQVGQSLGDWCYNLSLTAPFLAFRSSFVSWRANHWVISATVILRQHLSQNRLSNIRKPQKRESHSKKLGTSNNLTKEKWCTLTSRDFWERKTNSTIFS